MNKTAAITIAIGTAILCGCILQKNSNFLDVRRIFIQHIRIFKENAFQMVGIYIAPVLLSVGFAEIKCLDKEILGNLNIVLSILTAMFFSVLSILGAFSKEGKSENYKKLLKETFNTTIFEVLLCLMLLFISFVLLFIGNFKESFYLKIESGVIYYLSMVMILNILVVVKRIKVLFDNQ